ncbi:MAG: hypothetical protein ACP5L0_07715, partial [Caldisphaera sp.]
MSLIKYLINQYLIPLKIRKKYDIPFLNTYLYIDYFHEYSQWIPKLTLPKNLKILDIGSDYGSLYYY